jgi:hypothetical protein
LKRPKLEIFGSGAFTQIRPVWVGELGTRPKNSTFWWNMLENRHFCTDQKPLLKRVQIKIQTKSLSLYRSNIKHFFFDVAKQKEKN